MENKLKTLLVEFIHPIIVGYEKAAWTLQANTDYEIDMTQMLLISHCSYFNSLYKDLLLKTDDKLTNQFKEMNKLSNHNYICLLILAFKTTMEAMKHSDRQTLDPSSLEKYLLSVSKEIKFTLENRIETFDFCCKEKQLSQYDPQTPIFFLDPGFYSNPE